MTSPLQKLNLRSKQFSGEEGKEAFVLVHPALEVLFSGTSAEL